MNEDSVLYFGYGSNLDCSDWSTFCEKEGLSPNGMRELVPAWLPDHRMVWHYHSTGRKGGAADVVPGVVGEAVPGVLYSLKGEAIEAMRMKEGSPTCYQPKEVMVLMADGEQVSAMTYVVTSSKVKDEFIEPRPEYVELIRNGLRMRDLPTTMLDDSLSQSYPSFPVKSIFAYGTLRKWCSRHDIITRYAPHEAVDARGRGILYDFDIFPGMHPMKAKEVKGELYSYKNPQRPLEHLDHIEGHWSWNDPECLFNRRIFIVEAEGVMRWAWVYMVKNPTFCTEIESGDWIEHTKYRRNNR